MSQQPRRRALLARAGALLALAAGTRLAGGQAMPSESNHGRRWYEAALRMKRLAESRGDQPYGAVLVLDGRLVGEGPSRVVALGDATAHAERMAIRDAQRRLNRAVLPGSVLYSTSRPCPDCEAAAAAAGVGRMYFGESLQDAGMPRGL
jgi:tRNA(Arg) A34 adenosine deaminase TadA